jgi:hypothetical protein
VISDTAASALVAVAAFRQWHRVPAPQRRLNESPSSYSYIFRQAIANPVAGNPDVNMKLEQTCSQPSACFERDTEFREADESLDSSLRPASSTTSRPCILVHMHCLLVRSEVIYFIYFHGHFLCNEIVYSFVFYFYILRLHFASLIQITPD